jgi:hypothetical protein
MAPISELVLRIYNCSYIYSLIRLSTKLAKKSYSLSTCYLLSYLQQALVQLGHYLTKPINQNWEIRFPS